MEDVDLLQVVAAGEALEATDVAEKEEKKKMPSTVPLVLPSSIKQTLLFEVDDGELDLSGDIGAVGRMKVSSSEIIFDIKGRMYEGHNAPCNSLLLVNIGPTEAKIESVINEYFHFDFSTAMLDSESLLHGVVDGFDLQDDDDDNVFNSQTDQGETNGAQKKTTKKAAKKTLGKTKNKPASVAEKKASRTSKSGILKPKKSSSSLAKGKSVKTKRSSKHNTSD
eukprot:GILK01006906.1.p1 GENE.GILK01006906.1~~GILK01006906.1.p1  ORF type:complete len:234 (+),score=48.95 GILK01006906.1:36-704(+)